MTTGGGFCFSDKSPEKTPEAVEQGVVNLSKSTPPMNTENLNFPPLAQALGRLRQPARAWPYAPRPPELAPAPQAAPAEAANDFLRILPEPALTGDLPPVPAPQAAPVIPGAEAARTYWFDL